MVSRSLNASLNSTEARPVSPKATLAKPKLTRHGMSKPNNSDFSPLLKSPPPALKLSTNAPMNSANDHKFSGIQPIKNTNAFQPRTDNTVIAISSGVLFDFSEDHKIASTEGHKAYTDYQIANETKVLEKGQGFKLIQKIYSINEKFAAIGSKSAFDVIITSKNSPKAAIRTLLSIDHHQVPICRSFFTSGESPFKYAKASEAILYLTTNPEDAKSAIDAGVPAAQIFDSKQDSTYPDELRISFDADAVIFTDDSERIAMTDGLGVFYKNERENAHQPLEKGPLYPLLLRLSQMKKEFTNHEPPLKSPIRIAITTARSAPADVRVLRTLEEWGIEVDDTQMLGGKNKGPVLEAFAADLFFDDKLKNVAQASKHVLSCHVHYGVSNEATQAAVAGYPADIIYKP